jgi:hypothetical protein
MSSSPTNLARMGKHAARRWKSEEVMERTRGGLPNELIAIHRPRRACPRRVGLTKAGGPVHERHAMNDVVSLVALPVAPHVQRVPCSRANALAQLQGGPIRARGGAACNSADSLSETM